MKVKTTKTRTEPEIMTLDQTHRTIANNFRQKKMSLDTKKNRLCECQKQLNELNNTDPSSFSNTEYIVNRSKLKEEINKLTSDIYNIDNDVSEIDYYNNTNTSVFMKC